VIDRRPHAPNGGQPLPDFQPVERRYRHDGWTPERQRAFIAALADTGSVKRAAQMVNMTPDGAYYLRRQRGAESFRRAWEAALDFGVQRLKDLAFERAIEGDLVPVMSFGKLVGYRRKTNDRLLMFCLRMNARQADGRRYAQTYFDPNAPRLTGAPLPSGKAGPEPRAWEGEGALHPTSVATPVPTPAEQLDDQAALIRGFDPVELSLEQIETLQALLAEAAAAKRALRDDPAANPDVPLISAAEGLDHLESGVTEDETGTYYRAEGEAAWDMLDPQGLEEVERIDEAVASVRAAKEAEHRAALLEIAREVGMAVPEGLGAADRANDEEPSPRT
jgi:hypothetical protein